MDSNPTLHDFVLHLITNQDARQAFQLDPQGTLHSAGLGDLTPADVRDVVPLVVDLTPVRAALPELGAGQLTDDPATAIGQLQQIVHQLPLINGGNTTQTGADVNVATFGAITATPAVAGIGTAASASAGYDVGLTLDAVPAALGGQLGNGHPLDIVTSPVGTVTGGITGDPAAGGSPIGGVTGILDDLTGGLSGGLTGDLTGGLTGGMTGELTGGLTGHLTGELSGTIGGLTGTAGALTGGLTGDLTGHLTGGLTGSAPDIDGGVSGNGLGSGLGNTVGNVIGGLADPHEGGLLGGITDGLL